MENVINTNIKHSFLLLGAGVFLSGVSAVSYLSFLYDYLNFATASIIIGSILELVALIKLGHVTQPFKLAIKGVIGILVLMSSVVIFDILAIAVQKENFVTVTLVISTLLSVTSLLLYFYTVYNIFKGCRVLATGGLSSDYGQHTFKTFIILLLIYALFSLLSMVIYIVNEATHIEAFGIIYIVVCCGTFASALAYSSLIDAFLYRTYKKLVGNTNTI